MKKASVIVPVYNSEKTLHYCLDSILNQTYKNIEIIIVNDGSKDGSSIILENYSKSFPSKIKVYNQKNSGAPTARNYGIKNSTGEYLFFVDSDDYIDCDYVENFIKCIEKTNADMVVGGYRRVKWNGDIIFERHAKKYPWTKFMFVSTCGRVYRKEALEKHDIKFLNMNIGEDVYMNIMADLKLKVRVLDYIGYDWVNNENSISNTAYKGFNQSISFIPFLEKILEDIRDLKMSPENRNFMEYFFIKTCVYYVLHSGRGVDISILKNEAEKIFTWLKLNYPDYAKNIYLVKFGPRGERLSVKLVVYLYILLKNIHLEKLFLRLYSIL